MKQSSSHGRTIDSCCTKKIIGDILSDTKGAVHHGAPPKKKHRPTFSQTSDGDKRYKLYYKRGNLLGAGKNEQTGVLTGLVGLAHDVGRETIGAVIPAAAAQE